MLGQTLSASFPSPSPGYAAVTALSRAADGHDRVSFCQDSCLGKYYDCHFTDGENRASQRPNDLPKAMQLPGRAETRTQVRQTLYPHFSKCDLVRGRSDITQEPLR